MVDYDVIICGAGPAGSTAAKFISEKGFNVAIIDKSIFPREKICGGALRLNIDKFGYLMNALKKISLTKSYEVIMNSPSLRYRLHFKSKSPLILHIKRIEFDNLLLNLAIDSGANFIQSRYVKKVIIKKDKSCVIFKNGDELSSKILVGAGGVFDPINRFINEKYNYDFFWHKSDIAYMMVGEYLDGENFIVDNYGENNTSHFYLKPNNMYGYGWIFPKSNVINFGLGLHWSDIKNFNKNFVFNSFIKNLKEKKFLPKNYKLKQIVKTIIPLSGPIKKTFDDRIILIGDAAGFISPLTGDGLYYSISSGKYAAETINLALKSENYTSKYLKNYQSCWQQEWGFEMALLKFFTKNFHNQTERLIKNISSDEKLKKNIQDIFTGRKDASDQIFKIIPRIVLNVFKS